MCRRSIGFWKSIDDGIIRRVMKSHAAHIVCQSSTVGRPNGVCLDTAPRSTEAKEGDVRRGKVKAGRSRSQREYFEALSVQRWTGRRFASVKRVYTSCSENYSMTYQDISLHARASMIPTLCDTSTRTISSSLNEKVAFVTGSTTVCADIAL